jgi:hypothetical protein
MSTKVSDVNEAGRAAPARLRAGIGAQVGKFTLYCFAQSGNPYELMPGHPLPAATANR